MFALKHIGLSRSKHPDITGFQKSLSLALASYVATPEGTPLSEETQMLGRQMVQQFLALRQNGLTVSLLFFLAEPFIAASKSHDARLEKAVCQLLEDHSWVYNRKALIVLRDLAAERKSGMSGTFDTACYHSLKAHFSAFLTEEGDPMLCARGLSTMETLRSLLFGIKPSAQDRLLLQKAVSLRSNGEKKDSSLFCVITKYLNLEGDTPFVQKQKEALESELEQHTIYSRRLLHIIAHSESENGVGLEQFLASEYLSLRPKIVSAILDSENTSLLPILLTAEKLSKEPEEDNTLKTRALHKLIEANTATLYKDFAKRLVRGGDSELLGRVFRLYDGDGQSAVTALKTAALKALCEKETVILGTNTQDVLSQWIAQTMFLPFAQPLPVLPLPIVKQIWPSLSVHLEIENRLPRLFDCLLGAVPNNEESHILSVFQGNNFPFFLTELIKVRLVWPSDYSNSEHRIRSAFLCSAEKVEPFLNRFSDFDTWSFKMQHIVLELPDHRNPITLNSWLSVAMIRIALKASVGYQAKGSSSEPALFTQLSKSAYQALMQDEPGMQHETTWIKFYAYWKDVLLQYGHFQTECHDQDRFKQAMTILQKIELRLGKRLAVEVQSRIVLSQPEAVLTQMHNAIDVLTSQRQPIVETFSWNTFFERMPMTQTGYSFSGISEPVRFLTASLGQGWHPNCTESFREQVLDYCCMDLPEFILTYQGMIEKPAEDPEKAAALVVSTLCMVPYTNLPTHEVLGIQAHVLGLLRAAMDLESIDHWTLATLAHALHSLPLESQQAVYKDIQGCLQSLADKHVFFEKKPNFEFVLFENNSLKPYCDALFEINYDRLDGCLTGADKVRVFGLLSSVWLLNISAKSALALQETWQSDIAEYLFSIESEIGHNRVLVAIDSLWGTNIPVGNVLELVQYWEEVFGGKMVGLRPSRSARPKEIPDLPLVEG